MITFDVSHLSDEFTVIYSLCEPDGTTVRYIGKTLPHRVKLRYKRHLFDKPKKKATWKENWISKLMSQGLRPVMNLVAVVPTSEWVEWEVHYIKLHLDKGCNLTNGDSGGGGMGSVTDEQRARMREIMSRPDVKSNCSGKNHWAKRDPSKLKNLRAALSSPEYKAKVSGDKNAMSRADVKLKHLASVTTAEQLAIRSKTMSKLHADAEFSKAHKCRLEGRAAVIAMGDMMFGGKSAACRYFGVSDVTMVKFLKHGTHGFSVVGTVSSVDGAIPNGYSVNGVWFTDVPEKVVKLPHGLSGKKSNAHK